MRDTVWKSSRKQWVIGKHKVNGEGSLALHDAFLVHCPTWQWITSLVNTGLWLSALFTDSEHTITSRFTSESILTTSPFHKWITTFAACLLIYLHVSLMDLSGLYHSFESDAPISSLWITDQLRSITPAADGRQCIYSSGNTCLHPPIELITAFLNHFSKKQNQKQFFFQL